MNAPRETMTTITARVAAEHGITSAAILSPNRGCARISQARQAAYAACRATGRYSFPKIAQFFNRDPSSIQTGVKAHAARQAAKSHSEAA